MDCFIKGIRDKLSGIPCYVKVFMNVLMDPISIHGTAEFSVGLGNRGSSPAQGFQEIACDQLTSVPADPRTPLQTLKVQQHFLQLSSGFY